MAQSLREEPFAASQNGAQKQMRKVKKKLLRSGQEKQQRRKKGRGEGGQIIFQEAFNSENFI